MSADVLARVHALERKAQELASKGHIVRAAEHYARAAEAAAPLGADNLVAVAMRLRQSALLSTYALISSADAAAADAPRAESVALLLAAVAVVEGRRNAGTLLEGACAAAEEAWRAKEVADNSASDASATAAWVAARASLVGYEVFLRAAMNAAGMLLYPRLMEPECSAARRAELMQTIDNACALLLQPRRLGDEALETEAKFVTMLRTAVGKEGTNGLEASLVARLAGALTGLQRSGVLTARGIEAHIQRFAPVQMAQAMAVKDSMMAPGLRSCALPGCGAKEAHPAHFKSCAACRAVVYCCREHQVAGWPSHKKACKAARKAAADAEAGCAGASGA